MWNGRVLMPQTFLLPGDARFEIGPDALAVMFGKVQDTSGKPESGGVMLGRYLLGSDDTVVDEVTTPLPGDRCTRTSYYRGRKSHQAVIDRRWLDSCGTCNYLGEWHTHPEPEPSPSRLDLRTWKRRLRQDRVDHYALFFVIVGQECVRAWAGDRRTLRIHALTHWSPLCH
jgi:integrative and conjugative element protein (TIGR02256 family)